jgi:hypothetical protein
MRSRDPERPGDRCGKLYSKRSSFADGVVDQEIPEHRAAEGPADESRSHPRLSQCRAPLSPNQSAKNSGHFRNP